MAESLLDGLGGTLDGFGTGGDRATQDQLTAAWRGDVDTAFVEDLAQLGRAQVARQRQADPAAMCHGPSGASTWANDRPLSRHCLAHSC